MKTLIVAAALSLVAVVPASAQMMGDGMGAGMAGRSCINGAQFVPCPPMGGMQPGMMRPGMAMNQGPGMQEPGMADRRMTRREMREQRRMMRQQNM